MEEGMAALRNVIADYSQFTGCTLNYFHGY